MLVVSVDGADENNGNVTRAFAPANQLGGHVAVEARHVRIEQDQRAFFTQQEAQRRFARLRLDDRFLQLREHLRQRKPIVRLVIDDEDGRFQRARRRRGQAGELRGSHIGAGQVSFHTRRSHTRIIDTS